MNKLSVLSKAKNSEHHIYYNISIPHDDSRFPLGNPSPAIFQEVREQPLLYDPEDYVMSVIRFSVPTQYIPLFIMPIQQYPNTDPNLSTYSVTLSFGGVDNQVFLAYIPENSYIPVPPPPAIGEGETRSQYVNYYSVYSIQHFLDMINTALKSAFLAIGSPPVGITQPPMMTYSPLTRLFSMNAQTAYATSNPGTIQIFFNNFLNVNFETSFNQIYYGYVGIIKGKNAQFVIESTPINNMTLATLGASYVMTQDYNTIPSLTDFDSIVFITGSLPIRSEWISSQIINTSSTTNNTTNFQRILTDFEVDLNTGFETRSLVKYFPVAEYRRVDLFGRGGLYNIDLQVYWRDTEQNLYPILIPDGEICSVKILFEKK